MLILFFFRLLLAASSGVIPFSFVFSERASVSASGESRGASDCQFVYQHQWGLCLYIVCVKCQSGRGDTSVGVLQPRGQKQKTGERIGRITSLSSGAGKKENVVLF